MCLIEVSLLVYVLLHQGHWFAAVIKLRSARVVSLKLVSIFCRNRVSGVERSGVE